MQPVYNINVIRCMNLPLDVVSCPHFSQLNQSQEALKLSAGLDVQLNYLNL